MKIRIVLFLVPIIALVSCDNFSFRKEIKTGDEWVVSDQGDSMIYRYDKKGRLSSITTVKNMYKHGLAKKFYDNGNLEFLINYEEGYKNGEVVWYYENGKVYRESNYIKGKIYGIQKKYYETGDLLAEIPYQNGQVLPGTKEYKKDGTLLKLYPSIKHEFVDKLAFNNKYIVKLYLSNNSKVPKFYKVYYSSSDNNPVILEIPTKKGIGELTYTLGKSGFIMEKITVRAKYTTALGNPFVLEKRINVAADNKVI